MRRLTNLRADYYKYNLLRRFIRKITSIDDKEKRKFFRSE